MDDLLFRIDQALAQLRQAQPDVSLWSGDAATSCSKALLRLEAELYWLRFKVSVV